MPSITFEAGSVRQLKRAEVSWKKRLATEGKVALTYSRLFEGRSSPMFLVIDYDLDEGYVCEACGAFHVSKLKTETHP